MIIQWTEQDDACQGQPVRAFRLFRLWGVRVCVQYRWGLAQGAPRARGRGAVVVAEGPVTVPLLWTARIGC